MGDVKKNNNNKINRHFKQKFNFKNLSLQDRGLNKTEF